MNSLDDLACVVVPAVVGLIAGGWLPLLIERTPMRMRILGVSTHCSNCGNNAPSANAWTARFGGRLHCDNCDALLWRRMPVLELVCALSFACIAARFGWSWALPAYLLFAFASIALTVIDVRHHLLPNRIIYPTLFASILWLSLTAGIDDNFASLTTALIGMFAAWLFFFVVWFIYPRGMGFGDVRLSLLVGLFAGWIDIGNVVIALFVGLLLGAVSGLAFVALRRTGMRDPIPYGPFLIAGAWISIFFAEPIAPVIGI